MSDATLATIAENIGVDFPDDDAKKDALFDALNELIDEAGESAELRAQVSLVFAAVDDYAHGRILLFELCDRIGAPYPADKKVVSLAARVKELEAENDALRAALADIARGDYSDPLCMKTPEQRAREALAPKKEKP